MRQQNEDWLDMPIPDHNHPERQTPEWLARRHETHGIIFEDEDLEYRLDEQVWDRTCSVVIAVIVSGLIVCVGHWVWLAVHP